MAENKQEVLEEVVEEIEYFYMGRKMNLDGVIRTIGMVDQPDENVSRKINALIESGALRVLESKDKQQKLVDNAEATIELEDRIVDMEVEEINRQQAKRQSKNDQLLKHEEVEFEVQTSTDARKVLNHLESKGIQHDASQDIKTGSFNFVMYDITEAELAGVARLKKGMDFSRTAKEVTNKTINATSSAIKTTLEGVVAPTAKAATKITASTVRSTAAALTKTGASVVTSTVEETAKLKQTLSEDQEVLKAKRSLIGMRNSIRNRLFGGSKGSGFNIK